MSCSAFARAVVRVVAFAFVALIVGSVHAIADPSPTGRTPRIIWTAERQAVWARMKREYDARPSAPTTQGAKWYALAKRNADCACRYSDNGIWGTLLFQMTGDRKYADLAYAQIQKSFFPLSGAALSGNFVREYSIELVMMYDWLYPGLSAAQRTLFLAKLNEMFTTATAPSKWLAGGLPYRVEDTDQTTGTYFGVVLHYLATGDTNPIAAEIYNRVYVGGLDATGAGTDTWRNAIRYFVTQMAQGGEWMESAYYNNGTVRLLMMGAEGIRTATGVDHFPEVHDFVKDHGRRLVQFVTPDLNQTYQWGDEQFVRNFADRVYAYQTTGGMVAGLTQDDPEVGPYIEQLIYSLDEKYGAQAEPWGRFFLLFNPYAARRPIAEMPNTFFAAGQGILLQRTGWTAEDSLFGVQNRPSQLLVDHQVFYFGDFQLYRRGEWAITHPIGYDESLKNGDAANAMLIGGLSESVEYRHVQAVDVPADNSYVYTTATMGGQRLDQNSWDPPATYLHEWTRSVLYLPSADKRSDTIVVHDRVNAQQPVTLPKFDHYKSYDMAAIKAAPALKQWFLHMPTQPTITGRTTSWMISAQQQADVTTLLPPNAVKTAVDESSWWPAAPMPASERRWHLRLTPSVEQQWDTFLNVVQVHDAGTAVTSELVRSIANDVDGALVHRAGQADALVMFNAISGPNLSNPTLAVDRSRFRAEVQTTLSRVRLRQKGYQMAWLSASGSTEVLLMDLDPTIAWGVSVDNGIEMPVTVGVNGVTRLSVAGGGGHLVRLRAAGEPPAVGTGSIIVLQVCPPQ